MRIDNFLISVVILLFFLLAGTLIITDQSDKYDFVSNTSTFNNTQAQIDDLESITKDMKPELDQSKGVTAFGDMFGWLLSAGQAVIKLVWKTVSIPKAIISDFMTFFGVPGEFQAVFFLALMIMVIFFIVYMYYRFQPR